MTMTDPTDEQQHVLLQENEKMKVELQKAKEKFEVEMSALTARLNDAKKNEAAKARDAARSAQLASDLQSEVDEYKKKEEDAQVEYKVKVEKLEKELKQQHVLANSRKTKVKQFVEKQSEEIKELKKHNETLAKERDSLQSSKDMLAERLETLETHVQELETACSSLEAENKDLKETTKKLSLAKTQLEVTVREADELKKKREAAKHETMVLLRSLEHEKNTSSQIQHALKYTLLPKALSQQELLSDSLKMLQDDLEVLLHTKFSGYHEYQNNSAESSQEAESAFVIDSYSDVDDDNVDDENGEAGDFINSASNAKPVKQQPEYVRLLNGLEDESKKVSRGILALASNVERLHSLIESDSSQSLGAVGNKTCASVIVDLLTGNGASYSGLASASHPQ